MPQIIYQKYNLQSVVYQASQWVTVPQNCNGFIVTNTGDTIVQVNDNVLYPGVPGTSVGDSITFGGNEGETYVGNLQILFQTPLGVLPQVQVVFKVLIL